MPVRPHELGLGPLATSFARSAASKVDQVICIVEGDAGSIS